MNWDQISGVLRAFLQVGTGYLVGSGLMDNETAIALGGALLALGSVIWSVWTKKSGKIIPSNAMPVPVTILPAADLRVTPK